jgi:hypothetical protein
MRHSKDLILLVVVLANKALNVTRLADELCPLLFVKCYWEAHNPYSVGPWFEPRSGSQIT